MVELTNIQYYALIVLCLCLGFLVGFALAYEMWGNPDNKERKK